MLKKSKKIIIITERSIRSICEGLSRFGKNIRIEI